MNGKTASEEATGTVFPSINLPAECATRRDTQKKAAVQVQLVRRIEFTRLKFVSKHFQSGLFVVRVVSEDVCLPLMISKKTPQNPQ